MISDHVCAAPCCKVASICYSTGVCNRALSRVPSVTRNPNSCSCNPHWHYDLVYMPLCSECCLCIVVACHMMLLYDDQGCLAPVTIIIPPDSVLNPCATAAVVGGNVLTSQRVTDVILKAFGVCAASQGCMNNLTLGHQTMGYYETIAGGAGAGPTWHG